MSRISKEDIISHFDMIPLDVEGGMWKAMFRSDEKLPEGSLPGRAGERDLYGSILYLLAGSSVSRMHRLAADEIWHFYMGVPCELLVLRPDGTGYTERLGHNILAGETVTAMVPRGCWQGVRIAASEGNETDADSTGENHPSCDFALLGTTMAPGYEDSDYEDGTEELLREYPEFSDLIRPLLARPEQV